MASTTAFSGNLPHAHPSAWLCIIRLLVVASIPARSCDVPAAATLDYLIVINPINKCGAAVVWGYPLLTSNSPAFLDVVVSPRRKAAVDNIPAIGKEKVDFDHSLSPHYRRNTPAVFTI